MSTRPEQTGNYPPVGERSGKSAEVERMFDSIAPRYDLLNRVLSAGIDQGWRKAAVRSLGDSGQLGRVLDVATGTGDLALIAADRGATSVVGVDLSEEMLGLGRDKIRSAGASDRVEMLRADASHLPFPNGEFDNGMVAFGVRNFEDVVGGLAEIRRVIQPGGRLVVLEFSSPAAFPVKQLYRLYSRYILPGIGALISGDSRAYRYLPDSVREFPSGESFTRMLVAAGFVSPTSRSLTFGIASIYTGTVDGVDRPM